LQAIGDTLVPARNGQTRGRIAFQIELDRERLKALEEQRQGGDLYLKVRVEGQLFWAGGTRRRSLVLDDATRPINQSDWARLRQEMGVGETLLLEIPAPSAQNRPDLAQAVTFWREAREDWMQGQYRDAVGKCRQVLEALPTGPQPAPNPRDRTKEERIEQVRRNLLELCHAALHTDAVCQAMSWDRADAELAVTECAGLLQLYMHR
jgi:hypothetical protein